MPLAPGTRLGPYAVTAKIGEGGMGEVYQARDTKLDRDVALKVLPEAFTSDPDRLARFKREAKVLASLNHPNIGSIFGLEEVPATSAPSTDGDAERSQGSGQAVRALVLELVEGPTLADRIAKGPIPIDEALPIAKQIAEAHEAAHEQGVIHSRRSFRDDSRHLTPQRRVPLPPRRPDRPDGGLTVNVARGRAQMRMVSRPVPGFLLACLLVVGASASAQSVADSYTPVTDEMLVDPPPGDWPMWRRTYGH